MISGISRYAAPAVALIILPAMVLLSRDFGATWDERALQGYGEQIWRFYTGAAPRSSIDFSFGYMRFYGALPDVTSVAIQRLMPEVNPWIVRHAVNSVFGWAGIVVAFLMARHLFGGRAAWLAALFLVSMPRYISESMNNPKDLPFAVAMLAGLYSVVTIAPEYPYLTWRRAAGLAAAVALALNVRAMGLVLLGYAAVGLVVAMLVARETRPSRIAATAARFTLVVVAALIGGTIFWPWAQEQPLVRPIEAFLGVSTFNWGNPSLYGGQDLAASQLPWHYLPRWLLLTLPPVVVFGAALSIVRLWQSDRSRLQTVAIWAFVLMPATVVIVRHLTLYDSIRHMFFIVPPFAILAAAGWDALLEWVRRPAARMAVIALVAIGVAEPLWFQLRNHPNQTAYFTPAIGGPRGAFARYDMDYWGNCVLQALEWSASQAEQARMPLGVAANAWEVAVVDMGRFPALWFRQMRHGGYHLDIRLLKGTRQGVIDAAGHPDVLYRVATSDGTPLCVVLRGPEYPRLEERLAQAAAR
jgi:hypothetical protein